MGKLNNIVSEAPRPGTRPRIKIFPQRVVEYKVYDINPMAAPRMSRRDKWNPTPQATRYFKYKNSLSKLVNPKDVVWNPLSIQFIIPMPKSWSDKKKAEMNLQPHTSKPDLDNLLKAVKDSLLKDDSHVWCYDLMTKCWGYKGAIIFLNQKDLKPIVVRR